MTRQFAAYALAFVQSDLKKNKKWRFLMSEKELPVDLLAKWTRVLVEGLSELTDESTKKAVIERCGKTCALYHGEIEKIRNIKKLGKNVEDILEQMNLEEMWCGKWIKDGNIIYSICKGCGCPLFRAGLIELSPTFCFCSLGWVKTVFEIIFEEPVNVELKKAIGRGDSECHFVVHYKN